MVLNHLSERFMHSLFKKSIDGFTPLTSARSRVSRKVILRDRLALVITNAEEIRKTTEGKQLSLKVQFRLFDGSGQAGRTGKDLDNLLKIFCDVLPRFMDNVAPPKEKGLGLIDSDNSLFEIHCSKKLVRREDQEGIDLEIFDTGPQSI